ncbi:hypothetical protein STEG23_028407 [Scotinomys teguina]
MRANCEDVERPVWLLERCMHPVHVPADTNDHAEDPESTNIGTGAMDVGNVTFGYRIPLKYLPIRVQDRCYKRGLGQSASPVEVVDILGPLWALLWTRCGIIQQKVHHQDFQDFGR